MAAAADYFFDTRWKAVMSALALNAIPLDRESTGRKSADAISELLDDGWSLVIYPEGGRSPDGWGQDFKGGAAYLSARVGAPVVPVYIDGTGAIFGKGMKRPKPGRTRVVFGGPLRPPARRVDPPVQHPHPGGGHGIGRRGRQRLVDGASAGGARRHPDRSPARPTPDGAVSGTSPPTAVGASPAWRHRPAAARPQRQLAAADLPL